MCTMWKTSTPSTATPPLRQGSIDAAGSASGLSASPSLMSGCTGMTGLTGSSSLSAMTSIPEGRVSGGERMRRFSSRHVPSVAEDIAYHELLTPTMVMRFNGLMKYMKCNSAQEESQKQLIAAGAPEALVPEEKVWALQAEYSRRCAFGERMNLELMSSPKWLKLLEDIELLLPCSETHVSPSVGAGDEKPTPAVFRKKDDEAAPDAEEEEAPLPLGEGYINRCSADLTFQRVIHNCFHGGKRLDYELFCKALLLVGHIMWPEEELEAVLLHLVDRIIESAPPTPLTAAEEAKDDIVASANVNLSVSFFEPALHDLFKVCCTSNLINPGSPSHGRGLMRNQERPVFKAAAPGSNQSSASPSPTAASRQHRLSGGRVSGMSLTVALGDLKSNQDAQSVASDSDQSPVKRMTAASPVSPLPIASRASCSEAVGRAFAAIKDPTSPMAAGARSPAGSPGGAMSPGYLANGSPVVARRRQLMSLEQFLSLSKQLGAMPDLLNRNEVIRIFKRAEFDSTGPAQSSGLHGFLNREAFVDAIGQVALEAYSKEPFCEEYPEVHDRIYAFLSTALPSKSRNTNDRFLYGRGW